MKPRAIALDGEQTPHDAMRRIVATRFDEACELAGALRAREPEALHQFRIACKRLRYALERFVGLAPALQAAAEHLALVQDALGTFHDCTLLLAELPPSMEQTRARLAALREREAERGAALWGDAVVLMREILRFVDDRAARAGQAGPASGGAGRDGNAGEDG